mmetsp:Transcript_9386/g.19477  ORF Transcript_9386/g.19477 Transcript_9386/m.19477 type:complete len:242 (+) Transcript_9386:1519-2244(+)
MLSGKDAIDSFAEVELLVRFGDNGSDGTGAGRDVEEYSCATSFGFGVGDRGGVCSDGGKRLDDAWAKLSPEARVSISLFGGGGDNGMFGLEAPGGVGLLVRSRSGLGGKKEGGTSSFPNDGGAYCGFKLGCRIGLNGDVVLGLMFISPLDVVWSIMLGRFDFPLDRCKEAEDNAASLDTTTRDQSIEMIFDIETRICLSTSITSHSASCSFAPPFDESFPVLYLFDLHALPCPSSIVIFSP